MAATKETYSVSTDFTGSSGVVAADALEQEVRNSAITIALNNTLGPINILGDVCDIWFNDTLPAGDKTILDGLVAAHTGVGLSVDPTPVKLDGVPKSSEGKLYIITQAHPKHTSLMFEGGGDDIATGTKYGGSLFTLSTSSVESIELIWQFITCVNLSGGIMSWSGAVVGDYFDYELVSEASVGISNVGAGAYDKVEIVPSSGLHMYVPNGTMTGDWDLNLTETWNANVNFTKLTPIPSGSPKFFDYDCMTNSLTLNSAGTGEYNLFDFPINLAKFVDRFPILGEHVERIEKTNEKSKLILPQWKHKARLTNTTAKTLSLVWALFISRYDISF